MAIYFNTDSTTITETKKNGTIKNQINKFGTTADFAEIIKNFHTERLKNVPNQTKEEYDDAIAIIRNYEQKYSKILSSDDKNLLKQTIE